MATVLGPFQPQIVIEQLDGFRGQRQEARVLLPLPRTRICASESSKSSRFRSSTSRDRSPCSSISPTMARSREVRKLDQNRATSSTDNGTMVRLGVFTRNRLKAGRGLPKPIGARRQ